MTFSTEVFLEALTSHAYLRGATIALVLAALSQLAGSIIGFGLALLRASGQNVLRVAARGYVWILRAIPTLLILLVVWNALPQIAPALRRDWFSPFVAAFVALSFIEAALMAEILRSALDSVDPGQRLAARALGLSPINVMRKVLVPQMIRVAIPPTGNQFIMMVKLTSLASVISLQELLTVAQQGVSRTFRYPEYYAAAALYYLAIVSALMLLQSRLELRYAWTSSAEDHESAPAPDALPAKTTA